MRYKSFGLILIILTITISGCKSVETKNFNITIQDKLKNVDKFTKSSIFSEKCEFGSWSSVGWRIKARSLHKKKKWLKLANNVYTLENCYNFGDLRLSYYYLGRSAEELGYYTAAIEYYKLSKNSNHCDDNDISCGNGYVNPNLNTELHLNIIKEAEELRSKFKPVIEASILKTKDLISSIQKSNTFHQDKWELFKNIVKEYKKVRGEYSLNSILRKDRRLRILKTRIFSFKKELKRISSSEFEYFSGGNDDFFELYPVKIDQIRIIANSEKFIKQLKSKPYKDIVITIKALKLDKTSYFSNNIFDILIQKATKDQKPVTLLNYISALRKVSNSGIALPDGIFDNYEIFYTEVNNENAPIMSVNGVNKFNKVNLKDVQSNADSYLVLAKNKKCNVERSDKSIEVPSSYQNGFKTEKNLSYKWQLDKVREAEKSYNTWLNKVRNSSYQNLSMYKKGFEITESNLRRERSALDRIDEYKSVPHYESYSFTSITSNIHKTCSVDFYIIDQSRKEYLEIQTLNTHSNSFTLVDNLDTQDINYSRGSFNNERDVASFNSERFEISLLDSILNNTSKLKVKGYSSLSNFINTSVSFGEGNKLINNISSSYSDDFVKIKYLLDKGIIDKDEFETIKKKIIGKM